MILLISAAIMIVPVVVYILYLTVIQDIITRFNTKLKEKEHKRINRKVIVIAGGVLIVAAIVIALVAAPNIKMRKGVKDIVVDVAEDFGVYDIKLDSIDREEKVGTFTSDTFSSLANKQKLEFFKELNKYSGEYSEYFDFSDVYPAHMIIESNGNEYSAEIDDYTSDYYFRYLYDGNKIVYSQTCYGNSSSNNTSNNTSNNSSNKTTKTKCELCNGTGSVKYYYGSSDFEAIINGYDPYTFGPCSRCDGDGYYYK